MPWIWLLRGMCSSVFRTEFAQFRTLLFPVESGGMNNAKQSFHRVPIRSAKLVTEDDRRIPVQFVQNSNTVVQSTKGLRRLLLKFPQAFVHEIKSYESEGGGRSNLTMGFSLFDSRFGATEEQQSGFLSH